MQVRNNRGGFTLIEVLLVIAILAILAGVVIVAVNPSRQLANARDAQRRSDVHAILNAIHQYAVDHDGALPAEITTDASEVCITNAPSCGTLYDLSALTDGQVYLVEIPRDPLCIYDVSYCADNGTGYEIALTEGRRIMVSAMNAEEADIIVIQ